MDWVLLQATFFWGIVFFVTGSLFFEHYWEDHLAALQKYVEEGRKSQKGKK
jgi:hypothetical protein